MFLFRYVSHSLSLPFFSYLGSILPLIGMPFLRSMLSEELCVVAFRLFLLFVLLFVFVFVFLVDTYLYILSLLCPFLTTMSFAGNFLARFLLSAFLAFFLGTCSRFDLVWFRLFCDHS